MSTVTPGATVRGTVRGTANRANPAFAAGGILVPLLAFAYAATLGSLQVHTYVHVMAGVLWTGIDVFMALVVGPVLGGLSVEERASWFETFTPKMTFLMPTLATVTVFGGITLAVRLGVFPNSGPWVALFVFVSFVAATLVLAGRCCSPLASRPHSLRSFRPRTCSAACSTPSTTVAGRRSSRSSSWATAPTS